MELIILDKDFNDIQTVEVFSSLQWKRNYYTYSTFQLNCSASLFNLFDQGAYLYRKGYELMLIESYELTTSDNGESGLEVKGSSVEKLLDDRIVIGKQTFTGTPGQIVTKLLNDNFILPTDTARKYQFIQLGTIDLTGTSTTLELENDNVGTEIYKFLKNLQKSQRLEFDYLNNRLVYSLWQGLDRTDNQELNTWAVFSDQYENIKNVSYTHDVSDHVNVMYVFKGTAPTVINQQGTYFRRIEASTSVASSTSTTQAVDEKGKQELEKKKVIELVNGDISVNSNLVYRKDYDLGDLVTCIYTDINKIVDKRIESITEVYEKGNIKVTPKFGNDYLTIKQYIEREVNAK